MSLVDRGHEFADDGHGRVAEAAAAAIKENTLPRWEIESPPPPAPPPPEAPRARLAMRQSTITVMPSGYEPHIWFVCLADRIPYVRARDLAGATRVALPVVLKYLEALAAELREFIAAEQPEVSPRTEA